MFGTTRTEENMIHFKFMPTPSAQLHVGHAWLLLMMDALGAHARGQGIDVRFTLVIDYLMAAIQGLDRAIAVRNAESIIQDVQRLGIEPDAILCNDHSPLAVERCRSEPGMFDLAGTISPSLLPQYYFSLCNPSYFSTNAVLDATIGITHIIRGADQFHNVTPYRNFYALLGLHSPRLMYVPLLLDAHGGKISSGSGFLVSDLLDRMTPDALFCRLVHACVSHPPESPIPQNRSEAAALLLGEDGGCALHSGQAATLMQANLLARLVAEPRLSSLD